MTTHQPTGSTLVILASLTLLCASMGACDSKPGAQANGGATASNTKGVRYSHEALGISIAYPESWKVQKDFETFAIIGVSPQEGEEDKYGENVSIMAMTTPKGMSLEDFAAIQITQARELLDGYARRGQSFEVIGGERAARFDYVHTVDELRIVSITFILVRDDIAYAITCSSTLEDYDRYRATELEIANSFRFTG
jgi:hypothetical protein